MPANTPRFGLTYPLEASDPPTGGSAIQTLAEQLDLLLNWNVVIDTTSQTALSGDCRLANATSAAITETWPAPTLGARIKTVKTDASANAVSCTTPSGNIQGPGLIAGATQTLAAAGDFYEAFADGTNWHVTAQTGGGSSSTPTLRSYSGTTDTLVLGDAANIVESTGATAVVETVPANASVAFPVGTIIGISQRGKGRVLVSPGAAVILRSPNGSHATSKYGYISIRKRATNEWMLTGAAAAVCLPVAGGAAPLSAVWYSLATDGLGNWVAIAQSSAATMISSNNGVTWTAGGAAPSAAAWVSLATDGAGNWVAIANGSTATMISSNNGVTWTAGGAAPSAAAWVSLATDGAGNWVAIAQSSAATMYSTNNGVTWTAGGAAPSATSWYSLATDGLGNWVAIAVNSAATMISSNNGVTWTAGGAAPSTTSWYSLATDGLGNWVAIAANSAATMRIYV